MRLSLVLEPSNRSAVWLVYSISIALVEIVLTLLLTKLACLHFSPSTRHFTSHPNVMKHFGSCRSMGGKGASIDV